MESRFREDGSWKRSDESGSRADEKKKPHALLHDMIDLADLSEEATQLPERDAADAAQESAQDVDYAEQILKKLHSFGKKLSRAAKKAVQALGDFFYEVGYYAEYNVVKLGRMLRNAAIVTGRALLKALAVTAKIILWLPAAVIALIARPFWHAARAIRSVREIWYSRDPEELGKTWREILLYLGSGARRHTHLIFEVLGWLLPVAAGALFVFTVRTVLDNRYVLQLSYDDQVLGYVENEEVFETARQDVRSRIVYTEEDTGDQWSLTPTYMLAVDDGVDLMDSGEVADAILQSSGEEIVEATGFYLNGVFYGAVTEGERLNAELEAIKAPYATGAEGEYISFVVEPELVEGVYLRSSVVDYAVLGDLIHSQVAGEVRYTVQDGDTPSGIAYAHGLTLAELVNLNASEDILKSLLPGDALLVSQAVPFLQVQVVYRRVELEEVPYKTERKNTADLNYGFTKTSVKGVNGVNECTYDYTYVDGVLQSKTLVNTTVISAPINEEILVGTYIRPGVTLAPSTGGYMWPIPGYTYCSRGFTGLYAHNGIDICGHYGTPIYAAQSGVVEKAVYTGRGYGVYVIINHGGGFSSLYGHCSGLTVQAGQIVNQGDLIGYVGSTGNSTGNHCHFEIRINGTQVNPAPYVGYYG